MDEREQQRKIRHRMAVLRHAEEVSGSVAATCRYYGISRQVFYKRRRRFADSGEEALRDGSSAPFHSPNATKAEVVGKIIYLRQHYHFGPQKISMYLERYHDVDISHSRVYRVLKRLEPLPGTRKKHYQYTAIDGCTRIRVLRIYPRDDQKTAIQFLDYVLEKLPFRVEVVQTDNGAEFQDALHWHLLDRGIGHVYIKPATPRLNGKVERSHRIDAEEFYRMLDGVVIDDTELFNDKLQEWEDFYNFNRPHGGLDGQTPYERLQQKTTAST